MFCSLLVLAYVVCFVLFSADVALEFAKSADWPADANACRAVRHALQVRHALRSRSCSTKFLIVINSPFVFFRT